MDHSALTQSGLASSWPTLRRTGSMLVRHPAWVQAHDAILHHAAAPGTILLVGPPGTGKSALLRDLAAHWRSDGRAVVLVGQGDPIAEPAELDILLVDETLRRPADALRRLLAQRQGTVVLADVDCLATVATGSPATIVRLRPLGNAEMHAFAVKWLALSGKPGTTIRSGTLAHLVLHAGGIVRVAAQLLGAAVAVSADSGETVITGTDIDHAAAMRQDWWIVPEAAPPISSATERRQTTVCHWARRLATVSALAACVTFGWKLQSGEQPVADAQAPVSPVLPLLHLAEVARPVLSANLPAEPADPAPAWTVTAPSPPGLPVPQADLAAPAPDPAASIAPATARRVELAVTVPPPAGVSSQPTVTAAPAELSRQVELAPTIPLAKPVAVQPTRRNGGSGMVLVAQRGDTLESLYNEFYRDRAAPPYAAVVAANPRPLRPGAIVLFPEPLGGWATLQR